MKISARSKFYLPLLAAAGALSLLLTACSSSEMEDVINKTHGAIADDGATYGSGPNNTKPYPQSEPVNLNGVGGAEEVRIVWNDFSGRVVDGYEMSTYDTWTLSLQADDVILEGLTVENDAGRVGQAVALETRGDRIHINRCRLVGDQDTFFTKGYVSRIWVTDSWIEGTTDFIFGPSIVLFDRCRIHGKADSFLTAASTTERNLYGYVFRDCRVTADTSVGRLYLGRPWKSTARTVWIRCELPAAICPEGWRDWHDSARKGDVYYAEYRCTGPGADRRGRVAWSCELTDEEAAFYTPERIFAKKTGSEQFRRDWNPLLEETWMKGD